MTADLLKKLVPAKVKALIRLGREAGTYRKRIESLKGRKNLVLLIGTPIHTNLGDHLIAEASKKFITDVSGLKPAEIPTEAFILYRELLRKNVPVDATVFINGGGWMGDLWPFEQRVMNQIVRDFRSNPIVVLPQTAYFENRSPKTEIAAETAMVLKSAENLSLYVRDDGSVRDCVDVLGLESVRIAPDMALYYRRSVVADEPENRNVAGICLRDDREKTDEDSLKRIVLNAVEKEGLETASISTMSESRVSERERVRALKARLDSFASCGVVVTDRLHGMLFSYVTGTPCIAFDNKTRKVSGVYGKWLSGCDFILPCFEETDENDVRDFLSRVKGRRFSPKTFETEFTELKENVQKNV